MALDGLVGGATLGSYQALIAFLTTPHDTGTCLHLLEFWGSQAHPERGAGGLFRDHQD